MMRQVMRGAYPNSEENSIKNGDTGEGEPESVSMRYGRPDTVGGMYEYSSSPSPLSSE